MTTAKLLIATTNPGKLREIEGILSGAPVELVTLRDLPDIAEPEETGGTFAENARLKALYYAEITGLPSAADDSGIEIDALDNAPGVHSARWHGTDYNHKFKKIYEALDAKGAPQIANGSIVWSPDGKRIAASSLSGAGGGSLWIVDPAAAQPYRKLLDLPVGVFTRGITWANDGKSLIVGTYRWTGDIFLAERSAPR